MDARSLRIAGWSGIVFSILSLIVLPLAAGLPLPPVLGADGAAYASWYGAHRGGFLIGNYLGIAAFIPGLVQLAIVSAQVRQAEADRGWLSTLVLSCGTFTYAMFAGSLAVFQAMPFVARAESDHAAEAIGPLSLAWFALDGLAAIPFVLALGWATRTTRCLPSWFSTASWVVAGVAFLMSSGSLTTEPAWLAAGGPVTGVGFLAFFGWTLALSIAQLRAAALAD